MRLKAAGFLCGLCLLAAAGTPVLAGTISGGEDAVSFSQTVVTAHILTEDTPSDGNSSGESPSDGDPSGENPSDGDPSGENPSDDDSSGDTPPDGDSSGEHPSDGDPSGEQPSDREPAGSGPTDRAPSASDRSDHTASSGVRAGEVDTADASTWEYLFLLLVFSSIVITAVKLRKLYEES